MPDSTLHVIFGAGQIGAPLAALLAGRGHRVRLVRRAGGGPEGVELRAGDAADPAFATEAARGAAVVYHCMNPAYDRAVWARELPRLMDSLIAAAGRAQARLVVLDNLYMLGRTGGRPMNEQSPVNPCSRKGEIRARVAERLFEAHRNGAVRAVCGRASDFYGPGGVGTYFGAAFWPGVLRGRPAQILWDPDMPHAFHYTEDVVQALATLGAAPDDVTGQWWMLPAERAVTARGLIRGFGAALGTPIPINRVPTLALRALALVNPLLREILEMHYQFTAPFVIDDTRFRVRFPLRLVPPQDAARRTVEWAKRTYRRES